MAHPYIVRTRNWNVLGRTRPVLWTLPQTVLCCTAQPWYPNFGRPCANAQVRNFLSLLCDRSLIIFFPQRPHCIHHHSGCVPCSRPRASRQVHKSSTPCSYLLCHISFPIPSLFTHALIFHVAAVGIPNEATLPPK